MEFTAFHKLFFNASKGAFSRVTPREKVDSQITLTDVEAELVIDYFGQENIQIGSVRLNREKAKKDFLLYPENNLISLNLIHPKPNKAELRVYTTKIRGFFPNEGDIWFIFIDSQSRLVIGSMAEAVWNTIGQEDNADTTYQDEIEKLSLENISDNIPEGKILVIEQGMRKIYQRNPKLAIIRFRTSGYRCDVDPNHQTFISQSTQQQFMEAHHLIPIKFQQLFEIPLDDFDNLTSLCPNCHRAIHHAIPEFKYQLVSHLCSKKPELQKYTYGDIADFYNCKPIKAEQ